MEPGIYEASLSPVSGGFGEWQRGELVRLAGAKDFADFETAAEDAERDDSLSGRIQGEMLISEGERAIQSRIYRFGDDPNNVSYCIVYWIR